jgi:hypothetical protein
MVAASAVLMFTLLAVALGSAARALPISSSDSNSEFNVIRKKFM